MALIKCPECGRENVSDKAPSCPGCGYEIYKNLYGNGDILSSGNSTSSETIIDNGEKKQTNKSGKIILFVIAVIAAVVIFLIWYSSTRCAYPGCNEHKASSGRYCAYHKTLVSSYLNYSSSSTSNSSSTTASNSSSSTKRSISEVVSFGRKGVKINSADGVEVGVNIEKVTNKDIKYIYSTAYFYNAVGDSVNCEISGKSSKDITYTGPLEDDAWHTFYKDTIAWNKTIDRVVFTDFEVVYMDGTSEKCSGKVTATKDDDNYFKMN